ncbi:hypothetical protein [Mucilaginibacter sp. 22184]|uniref:hypothetical protein n=1 Tax=Mucilaginibacter sp. 22184 TaxID=3453887 RepID=UPI003F85B9E4
MPKPEMELKLKFLQRAAEKFTASLPDFHRPDLFQRLKTFLRFKGYDKINQTTGATEQIMPFSGHTAH